MSDNQKNINDYIKDAYDALTQAIKLANETHEDFGFYPAYGMGGYYKPLPKWYTKEELIVISNNIDNKYDSEFAKEILKNMEIENKDKAQVDFDYERYSLVGLDEDDDNDKYGWQASSSNC